VTPTWYLAGVLFALAAAILLLPWLRTIPKLDSLPALPWQAGAGALLTIAAIVGLYRWLGSEGGEPAAASAAPAQASESKVNTDTWADIAKNLSPSAGSISGGPAGKAGAEPMAAAVASLQRRLAEGGGSADDWELLAKSYEFLGRPADAAKARAHQLPPLPADAAASPVTAPQQPPSPTSGPVLKGEVSLDGALQTKAPPGGTLFIVAKAVDSPGPPVAVLRTTVSSWPVRFDLTDSQSMLPGRNLSSVGRVRVEARISQSGQPLPAAGDLQGSSGVVNPADRRPLQIVIDTVLR
jgi:hypothetical protein